LDLELHKPAADVSSDQQSLKRGAAAVLLDKMFDN